MSFIFSLSPSAACTIFFSAGSVRRLCVCVCVGVQQPDWSLVFFVAIFQCKQRIFKRPVNLAFCGQRQLVLTGAPLSSSTTNFLSKTKKRNESADVFFFVFVFIFFVATPSKFYKSCNSPKHIRRVCENSQFLFIVLKKQQQQRRRRRLTKRRECFKKRTENLFNKT